MKTPEQVLADWDLYMYQGADKDLAEALREAIQQRVRLEKRPGGEAITDSLWLLARMAEEFPGVVDGKTDVDSSELTNWIMSQIQELDGAKQWMRRWTR